MGIEGPLEKAFLPRLGNDSLLKRYSDLEAGGGFESLDGADGEEGLLESLVDEVVEGVDVRAEEQAEGLVVRLLRL